MKITKRQLRRIIKEQLSLEDVISVVLDDVHADSQSGRDLGYGLPEWIQSSIAIASDNVGKVYHYIEYKLNNMEQK